MGATLPPQEANTKVEEEDPLQFAPPPPNTKEFDEYVQRVFALMDADNNGKIDLSELRGGLRKLCLPSSSRQAQKIMDQSDSDKDGQLDVNEFKTFLAHNLEELQRVFNQIDVNNDGKISADEIQVALKSLYGVVPPADMVRDLVNRFDLDGDGTISRDEWLRFLILMPLDGNGAALTRNIMTIFDYWQATLYVDFGSENGAIWGPSTVAIHPVPPADDKTKDKSKATLPWNYMFSGGIAGAISRTATAPLDRLKTILQIQTSSANSHGIIGSIVKLYQEQGLRSFFRGNGVNCIKIAPESATKFFCFEQYKKALASINHPQTPYDSTSTERFIAGALAGATAQALIYPLEVIKTRLAGSAPGTPGTNGIADIFRTAVQRDGLRALYKGITPSLLGIVPYAGTDLAVYESLKIQYVQYVKSKRNSATQHEPVELGTVVPLVCGMMSSTVAQFISYPLNLVRTRMQAQGLPMPGQDVKYNGMVDVFNQTVRKEGVLGLYKGMGPNLMKVLPAVGISYAVFENMKALLGK